MPYRKIPIVSGEIYHVFNRSVAKQPIFLSKRDFSRAIECIKFYQRSDPPFRFSHYDRLPKEQKDQITKIINKTPPIIEILTYCLMPNHIHFLLKNLTENGIIKFMSNFQNSYAKYFNTKNERTGTLFQPMFQAVRIESDEQLLHVNRYIHLNPVTAYLVKSVSELEQYLWSSYPDYLSDSEGFTNKEFILKYFKDISVYKQFVSDQVDYQRKLDAIKHLALE